MSIAERALDIRMGLIDRGLPSHVADGFVANFRDESGLNPGINEIEPLVPGSRGGFGLAQWTGPRRVALESYAAQRGAPVSDVDTQLDFLMTELEGPERRAAQSILGAQTAPEAAAAVLNDFLRPAESHRARREANYLGGNAVAATNLLDAPAAPYGAPVAAPGDPASAPAPSQGNALLAYMQRRREQPENAFRMRGAV